MDLTRLFVRMAMWVRNPPPIQAVIVAAAILAVGLGLYVVEAQYGWPEWLTVNKPLRVPR